MKNFPEFFFAHLNCLSFFNRCNLMVHLLSICISRQIFGQIFTDCYSYHSARKLWNLRMNLRLNLQIYFQSFWILFLNKWISCGRYILIWTCDNFTWLVREYWYLYNISQFLVIWKISLFAEDINISCSAFKTFFSQRCIWMYYKKLSIN